MAYWLMKSEPTAFSIDDLERLTVSGWDGVRNYQARNMLRDQMQVGDLAFFYHSNSKPAGIVGVMRVVKAGYPDDTALDASNPHYDPSSTPDNPRWYQVDVAFVQKFPRLLSLAMLKQHVLLQEMQVLRKGNRLSITPVAADEWLFIQELVKTEVF
ncbi:EVE domain-containing protein [Beggiatoa leptomitoformis]|uniref:EVE domain-containing protein n=1 Tax=Beggiatoa leptomitoformis TaxID=288004 RepID=A0A2N9YF35_9GAMM|nr:EVE domain-containing protein [Beggiatoa leptomitoformis]ALG68629.1 EVE domain-containing protein [Beggiatoa leptomitoformis]AUI69025.1 EVE domain-containing protein [Beggiatoa leptomitoformis]